MDSRCRQTSYRKVIDRAPQSTSPADDAFESEYVHGDDVQSDQCSHGQGPDPGPDAPSPSDPSWTDTLGTLDLETKRRVGTGREQTMSGNILQKCDFTMHSDRKQGWGVE